MKGSSLGAVVVAVTLAVGFANRADAGPIFYGAYYAPAPAFVTPVYSAPVYYQPVYSSPIVPVTYVAPPVMAPAYVAPVPVFGPRVVYRPWRGVYRVRY